MVAQRVEPGTATPLTEREFLSSLGLVGLARTVVSVTVIAVVGLGFYAVSPDTAGWVLVPGAAILLVLGAAVTLFVIGLTLQYGDSAEYFPGEPSSCSCRSPGSSTRSSPCPRCCSRSLGWFR